MDETLEGAFVVSEFPVKRIDEENDAPVFTEGGVDGGPAVSTYTAERREDTTGETDPSVDITEAFAATDVMTDEDDDTGNPANSPTSEDPNERNSPGPGPGADILTYSLSGADAKYFVIVGSVDHPTTYDPDGDGPATPITDAGSLIFKHDHKLDFETKTRYTVTITATDPSGDADSVNVTVNLTNYNEPPTWVTTAPNSPAMVVYTENGKADVGIYLAKDPEGAGISYALVTTAAGDVAATDIEDRLLFSIDPLDGNLRFKKSPNYEKPGDQGPNNRYQVTVSATAVDDPTLTPTSTPQPGNHVINREITIVVDNVNEAPIFSETTDTLEIKENPDDPEKEPPRAAGFEYLLNRGVGKPAANLPAAPNLDVGIPVTAVDDDSTGDFAVGGYAESPAVRDRIDGLTYTLSGTDAAHFHVVPATGQILTLEKLDYEAKKEYKVTVTATDPMGESDSIDMTIEVTDVDEVPVPKVLVISGDASHTYEENGTDALGEYTVVAGGGANADSWTLEGPDASHFMLDMVEGKDMSRMLKFSSAPDYDAMADADGDNTYEVTVKVADSSDSDNIFGTFAVTVSVTDVNELGTLVSPTIPAQYAENGTAALGTFTINGAGADSVMWSLGGDDAGAFDITGGMLTFKAAPDYENPVDANTDNTYMVTVMAEAGGEMEMMAVTVMVTDANELGALTSPTISATYAENGTAALGTFTTDGPDTPTWTLEGRDADDFSIAGGVLSFANTPDFENPTDGNTNNTYYVIVKAAAGGEEAMSDEVAVTVTDVNELGTLMSPSLPAAYEENGTAALGTFTLSGGTMDSTAVWSLEGVDAGDFSINGGVLAFTSAPNFEMPADADGDNIYQVTVKAAAGGEMDMAAVSVMVTDANDAPMFAHATGTRSIAENTDSGMDIGNPVTATDEDGDTLTYTLGGTDAASFDIDSATGQLMTKAALDYETKMSYMVMVTATDPEGATDTRDITVNVTDVAVENSAPVFTDGATATRSVAENSAAGMNIGNPVMATDSDGDKLLYTLAGTDAASFDLDGATGQLMTKAALDYETKASYSVMVTATDGSGESNDSTSIGVTINVSNMDETGSLELSTMSPTVGVALTATLTDPDGSIANVEWQWSRSPTMDGTFTHIAEETMTYTPTAGDVGHYLKVAARYTDGHGSGKDEEAMTGKVSAAPNPILVKFDTNDNGRIDRSEAIAALRSYRAGEATRAEAIAVLRLYRES